jgi:threonine dehydrogenase-like Zn-dependent dehydrogenase
MQAIQFENPGVIRLIEVPAPSPPPGWARIHTRAAAICMTDMEVLRGGIAARYPLIPGHEWAGVVDRVGSAADEGWLTRRVTGDNEITCLECRYCRRGEWRRCPQYRQIGFAAPGAYAECLLAPVRNLHPLAESVSFEQGALLEPLGVGLAVAAMSGVRVGSTVAVLGAGPIGLNCLAAAKTSGARRILCLDRRAFRLEVARSWGAAAVFEEPAALEAVARELHPWGTDVVIEATGHPDLLNLGAALARFGGTLALAGYFGGCRVAVAPDLVHERNLRVLGAGNNAGFTETAAAVVGDGLLRTESMITHRFRVEDYDAALSPDTHRAAGYVKGVFVF